MKLFGTVRWAVVGLLFLGGMINYLDRAALSVAAPLLSKELSLSPAELGIVFSVFFFGYAAFCFVGGYASDRIGGRNVFAIASVVWSVFCGLTAMVFSFGSLLVVRLIFGMGEGPYGSAANKLVSNWFPRRQQATAVGWANAGTPLGGALAGPIVGFIALTWGWRASFVIIAAIGLCWSAVWMLMVTERPEQNRHISAAEAAEIAADQDATTGGPAVSLGSLLARPAVLATAFAFFGYAYILYFFLSWFPTYLTTARHLSLQSMSFVSTIPWLLGFIGLAAGGSVSDAIFRITGNAVRARKLVLVVGLLIAALCVALAGSVETVQAAVGLMAVSVFFMYLTGNTYWAIILDTVERDRVGGVGGFVHLIANLAGIVAPSVTGFMVQATGGSYAGAFGLAGGIAVLGALSVAVFVRAPSGSAGLAVVGTRL
ncbi:MFS transporter [Rhodopila sp.]|uniref:MFS transporter n=1 Tax=Rhodopila sp. TaxID=2480087 RepID=UPI003D10805A